MREIGGHTNIKKNNREEKRQEEVKKKNTDEKQKDGWMDWEFVNPYGKLLQKRMRKRRTMGVIEEKNGPYLLFDIDMYHMWHKTCTFQGQSELYYPKK